MIKTIVVDDEMIILNGLIKMVDWASYDMEIVAVAQDGKQALSEIKKHNPDLLITDIKMPFMDGLEVIQRAKYLNPDILVILISGYDDFKYAQNALQLKVFDYLLKPISLDHFSSTLQNIQEEYRRIMQRNEQSSKLIETQTALQKMSLKSFFRDIIYQNMLTPQLEIELDKYPYDLSEMYYIVLIVTLKIDTKNMTEIQHQKIKHFYASVDSIFDKEDIVLFPDDTNKIIICIPDRNRDELIKRVEEYVHSFYMRIKKYINGERIITVFDIGNPYHNLADISKSYQDAVCCGQMRFFMDQQPVIWYSKIKTKESDKEYFSQSFNHLPLISAIKNDRSDQITEELNELGKYLRANETNFKTILQYYLYSFTHEFFRSFNEESVLYEDIGSKFAEICENTLKLDTCQEVISYLNQNLRVISKMLISQQENTTDFYIKKAVSYIQENYMDSSINLDFLARIAKMHPNYFSMEFKKAQGTTYVSYLSNIRISKAKELLLNTDIKVNKIAKLVGYENATYFNSLFKKKEGYTPLEYRSLHARP